VQPQQPYLFLCALVLPLLLHFVLLQLPLRQDFLFFELRQHILEANFATDTP